MGWGAQESGAAWRFRFPFAAGATLDGKLSPSQVPNKAINIGCAGSLLQYWLAYCRGIVSQPSLRVHGPDDKNHGAVQRPDSWASLMGVMFPQPADF